MNRLIVVDGADCLGKTTLVRSLSNQLGWKYQHEGPPPAGMNTVAYYDELFALSDRVVFDRFHLGEVVYGYFGGRRPEMDLYASGHISDTILNNCGKIIVLFTTNEDWYFDHVVKMELHRDPNCQDLTNYAKACVVQNRMFRYVALVDHRIQAYDVRDGRFPELAVIQNEPTWRIK